MATKDSETAMTFMDHLLELRKRLIYSLWGALIGFLISWHFSRELYDWLIRPLCRLFQSETTCPIVYSSVIEPFMVYVKMGFVGGLFVSAPWIFYQIWRFLSPGLHGHERKWVLPFVFISTLMFVGGALFGYFVIFPFAFEFFLKEASPNIKPLLRMQDYLGFATHLLLAFGFFFEIPVIAVLLNVIGLVRAKTLWKTWRYAVAGIFVLAAIFTPADPYTMLLFGVPLSVLYILSLCLCSFLENSLTSRDAKSR